MVGGGSAVNGGHAVVLGGSLAGMCAAAALARHVGRVTLVERDALPDGPQWRRGVPQSRHTHNILRGGQNALEELFPGLRARLLDAGMAEVRWPDEVRLLLPTGWLCAYPSDYTIVCGTRPLLDWLLQCRVRELSRVRVLERTTVLGLTGDAAAVRGVRAQTRDASGAAGEPFTLDADFVVDATGRTSQAPSWLAGLGLPAPAETVVNAGTAYATALFKRPAEPTAPWKSLIVQATPQAPHSAILHPVEDGRWVVSVAAMGGERPPTDHVGFLEFTRNLRTPLLYETIRDAPLVGEIHGSGRTENRRRRYERLSRWPDRFLVLGDAAGCLNPSYGQGVSVAALCALDLARAAEAAARGGDPLAGIASGLRRRVARRIDAAWTVSANTDLVYPWTEGEPDLAARLGGAYVNRLLRTATTSPAVAQAMTRVSQLDTPAGVLFSPRVLLGALTGR
ncbi:NAD(P)/FAD-dependent oxidoreductase [Streptomyces sp. WMMC897]|uniref:NAD(P)/FAD-dependent oxidoreductase n=1 Tax=Streptomyces sp. WMMC897 TaxID=3014782 RepID=UPI0022B62044|nr:FAD-dependent monooxygenase [Streptomyces sp. WMMC897]MCZ7414533.1 FAD-dependent monooxygenase [Streptomyces sp. WMMC897]